MGVALAILGVAAALAGIVAIGFGMPSRDFSFGNTLIVSGAVLLGSGLVVFALAALLREVSRVFHLLLRRGEHFPLPRAEGAEPAIAPPFGGAKIPRREPVEAMRVPLGEVPKEAVQASVPDVAKSVEIKEPPKEPPKPGLFESFWPPGRRAASEAAAGPVTAPASPASPALTKPAVIKSGTVDGMAYTLYADGSIEADLPEGRAHFDSLDDLRARLDNKA